MSEESFHSDSCPWSNPQATCGPDTCACTLRKLLKEVNNESEKEEDVIVECFEWKCYIQKIMKFFIETFELFVLMKRKFFVKKK